MVIKHGFHNFWQYRAYRYGSVTIRVGYLSFLGTDCTFVSFHLDENTLVEWQMWKSLRTLAGMPSGPEDLYMSRFASARFTALVRKYITGMTHAIFWMSGNGWQLFGRNEFFCKTLVLSAECVKSWSFEINVHRNQNAHLKNFRIEFSNF